MKFLHCIPCWIAFAACAAWFALSAYWYVCVMRELCLLPPTAVNTPTVSVNATTALSDLMAKPLTIHFAANSDVMVTTDIDKQLALIVSYLKANPREKILITGHTNVHKSQVYTDQLGLSRANAAKSELVTLGISKDQIVTESKGQTQLAASPATAEGRYLNRRVVISVVK
jgi:outer membrane protein OmpA-like peptidoglycan-associated protein